MVQAQSDSTTTSTILLRSSTRSGGAPTPSNLDKSRYKIRQPESRKDDDDGIEEKPGTLIPSAVPRSRPAPTPKAQPPAPPVAAPIAAPIVAPIPQPPIAEPVAPSAQPAPAAPTPTPEPLAPPAPVVVQVKELLLGGSDESIDEYRKQIHPEDPRANVISISLAPAYYYLGSSSDYSFRDYSSHGPGLGLGMNVWVTPFFGVQSKFFSSFTGSVKSGGQNAVPLEQQNFEAGIRFRRHFGNTRKSGNLSWGIDYHDSLTKIGQQATTIIGKKSSGLSLTLEGEIPSNNTYAHTFQVDLRPRLNHSERNTTAEARSGTKSETNAVGLSLGGQWTLNRSNQVFWKGQYIVERNLFEGAASTVDPHTGNTPEGVSITNSVLIFYFGFKWGS